MCIRHHPHQTGLYWGFTRINGSDDDPAALKEWFYKKDKPAEVQRQVGRDFFHNPGAGFWRRQAVDALETVGARVRWRTVYDLLVLAPGIDYDYERSGMDDAEAIRELKNRYPAGFIGEAEIAAVKQKVENFTQGTFVLTVPNDNYRCMAAPYERACMIASVFKRRKLAAKVLLLDMNSSPRVKAEGFLHAFERLHRDYIEYVPSTEITGFDPFNRLVLTEFDEYSFDDAAIYPKVRASRLLEKIGIADPANPQKAAITDPFNYRLMNDERIYVIGDARSQPFSKSGNTASTEARYLARQITAYAQGVEIPWEGPQTMCFSGVRTEPLEAMSLLASYKFDAQANAFGFDRVLTIQDWSEQIARAGLVWGEAAYNEMFYYAVSG